MPNRVCFRLRADLKFLSVEIPRGMSTEIPEPSGVDARNVISLLRLSRLALPSSCLFTEAGHRVEGALLPVAPFAL